MNGIQHRTLLFSMLGGLALSASAVAAGDDMFTKADIDKDGRISAQEHAAAAQAMFAKMDADNDGRNVAAQMGGGQHEAMRMRDNGQMMASMDSDHDGVLTRAEYDAASHARFDRMDADKDGRITGEEMAAMHGMHGMHGDKAGHGAGHAGAKAADMKHDGMRGNGDRMAAMRGMMDTNQDGTITTDEHAEAARAMFTRMDTDKDGFVSKSEMEAGHAKMKMQH